MLVFDDVALADLEDVATKLLKHFPAFKIWAFDAPMGAGKTTLIKCLCKQLDVIDMTSSPTFSIINAYYTPEHLPVYHMDFYRLEHAEEALDIGLEEIMESENYCFMEWPSVVADIISFPMVEVKIEILGNLRRITATTHD